MDTDETFYDVLIVQVPIAQYSRLTPRRLTIIISSKGLEMWLAWVSHPDWREYNQWLFKDAMIVSQYLAILGQEKLITWIASLPASTQPQEAEKGLQSIGYNRREKKAIDGASN